MPEDPKHAIERLADAKAKQAVRANFMRMLAETMDRTTILTHHVDGLSCEVRDVAYELDSVKTLVTAQVTMLNLLAQKLGIPQQIALDTDTMGDDLPDGARDGEE